MISKCTSTCIGGTVHTVHVHVGPCMHTICLVISLSFPLAHFFLCFKCTLDSGTDEWSCICECDICESDCKYNCCWPYGWSYGEGCWGDG